MNNSTLNIKYLQNSAFKVETNKYIFIFDYFMENSSIVENSFDSNKAIIVFCSHSHSDHYNKVIFKWSDIRPDIKYILSTDIKIGQSEKDITFMSAYDEFSFEGLNIKAYGSTDLGISFLIKFDGKSLFHSGDLNWWHWYDESDEDNRKAEKLFKEEISKLSHEKIDVAFFPVDSRLKESYALGADYFISELRPKFFIPMHFREDFNITNEFANKNKHNFVEIIAIEKEGQEISIDVEA